MRKPVFGGDDHEVKHSDELSSAADICKEFGPKMSGVVGPDLYPNCWTL